MTSKFYDHLIIKEELTAELDVHNLDAEEKAELITLIDEIFHHHTFNLILSHLPEKHHSEFIAKYHKSPHDKDLLVYLKDKVTVNLETEISTLAKKIKKELLEDVRKSRAKS